MNTHSTFVREQSHPVKSDNFQTDFSETRAQLVVPKSNIVGVGTDLQARKVMENQKYPHAFIIHFNDWLIDWSDYAM